MYKLNDISIIIPTKDRPKQIQRIISFIANIYGKRIGKVIVVSSGLNIADILINFNDKLNFSIS